MQQKQALPDMSRYNAQLAGDAARVSRFMDGMTARVDNLLHAARHDDWSEVRRVSDYIARSSKTYGYLAITESARQLCQAIDNAENDQEIRRGLVRLIGVYGRAEQQVVDLQS